MPVVRRNAPFIIVRNPRRGMGQNTLAAGGLTQGDCMKNGMIIDSQTGFCVLPGHATPGDVAAAAAVQNVNVAGAAPPVCSSSFQAQPNNGNLPPSYFVDQSAATVCSQVNAANANTYLLYQIAVQNWVAGGSNGNPPPPPTYQTFEQAWAPNNMGGPPASVSTLPPGTPIPAGTFLTGGYSTPSGSINLPLTPQLTAGGAPTPVQSNAPGASTVPPPAGGSQQSNAPGATVAPPSSGILQTLQNLVAPSSTSAPASSTGFTIPWWGWVAAAGVGLAVLWPKGK